MNTILLAAELIAKRDRLLVDNDQCSVDEAIVSETKLQANAKAEAILDCIVTLYKFCKGKHPETEELILDRFKGSFYYHLFAPEPDMVVSLPS